MRLAILISGGRSETLQAAALIACLRTQIDDADMTLLVPLGAAGWAQRLAPGADVVELRELGRRPRAGNWFGAWRRLRDRRVDCAIVCSDRLSVRLLAYLAGIPRRLGTSHGRSALLLSETRRVTPGENRGRSWLRLATLLGIPPRLDGPALTPTDAARQRAEALIIGSGIDPDQVVVAIQAGASDTDSLGYSPARLGWNPASCGHLANQLANRHGAAAILVGTEADRGATDRATEEIGARHVDLCGELDDDELAAVLARCDLLIAPDSPLLHLAAAVGTPSIGLFGATSGRRRAALWPGAMAIQAVGTQGGGGDVAAIRVMDVVAGIESVA